ncbi:MAG: alkene reductase, partial [Deltaproteobacteria bacterium]
IFSKKQRDSWRLTTEAVHSGGACIFMQLMHCGRVGSILNLPPGAALLAPSVSPMSGLIWTDSQGEQPYDQPREMSLAEVHSTIAEYAQAARNAIDAGFDGVEVHGANGYLITQFLDPGSNQRTDIYGGDAQKRNRFAVDVTAAVIAEVGAERVGIRLSPHGVFNDMSGSYPGIAEQYASLAAEVGRLGLTYLHLVDHSAMGAPKPDPATVQAICQAFRNSGGGSVILSGGYNRERAEIDLQSGAADLIAFGRPFISNPDLVARLKEGYPLAEADQTTFYSPGAEGYIDYPVK